MSEISESVRPFGIAIDYDDTFTTDPEAWAKVIDVLTEAGAKVVCVTSRGPNEPITDFPGQVFYTSGDLKAEFMAKQFVNYEIKIWIDDMPEHIGPPPEIKFG